MLQSLLRGRECWRIGNAQQRFPQSNNNKRLGSLAIAIFGYAD